MKPIMNGVVTALCLFTCMALGQWLALLPEIAKALEDIATAMHHAS
jgi:hypothetical protein